VKICGQIFHRLLEDFRRFGMLRTSMLTAAEMFLSASERQLGQQHNRQVIYAVKPISSSARRATDFPDLNGR
jgi:hypothetical protein